LADLTSIEMCAGAGGQAVGLEQAGFRHLACVEIDGDACLTLRRNRPAWSVLEEDIRSPEILARAAMDRDDKGWLGVDLLAGGVPCPPFSVAGKQLGHEDERDLFPAMIDLTEAAHPRAVLIENVRGLLDPRFAGYRGRIEDAFAELGYEHMGWRLLNASDFGVPQLRPRVAMIALLPEIAANFAWPEPVGAVPTTVGEALRSQMASRGWAGAAAWSEAACEIAPALVGGSKKHGGPDLGPTRAKRAWAKLGVNAHTIAELPPGPDHEGLPRLTVSMAATLQGFPADWEIVGRKTAAYRQVGNAFPPPVAHAVGLAIAGAIEQADAETEALVKAEDLMDAGREMLIDEIVSLRQKVRRQERDAASRLRIERRSRVEKDRMRLEVGILRGKVAATEAVKAQEGLPWDDEDADLESAAS
jgi:DNA (cytosine-5)-methyltransferase 1